MNGSSQPTVSHAIPVGASYLGMILIWGTVPLAVNWSISGIGFALASLLRFAIAAILVLLLLRWRGERLLWDNGTWRVYVLAGASFFAMLGVFSGARFVPSGWIAVMYGLSPAITAVMAHAWLGEQRLAGIRLLGMFVGLLGLMLIFATALDFGAHAVFGLATILLAVTVAAATSVLVRRVGAQVSALATTAGGSLVALPFYLVTWWAIDGQWPHWSETVALQSGAALLYVATIGTGIVFALMYYVLKHVSPTSVSLIGMISPLLALVLGNMLNGEPLGLRVWLGTALILISLLMIELLPRMR
jgi:drug/metabolite transporter (DMT)-like permease